MDSSIVIVRALRTPWGRFGGVFKDVPATDLAAEVIRHLMQGMTCKVDMAIVGCALGAGLGQAPARQCVVHGGLGFDTPAYMVNRVCGSGLQSYACLWDFLRHGHGSVGIAGGMENMSRAPYILQRQRQSVGNIIAQDALMQDGLQDAFSHQKMGDIAERTAQAHGITRAMQEAYVTETIQRAQTGYQEGFFQREIISSYSIVQDEILSRCNLQKISSLPPAFGGTITAATASSIADGAAFSLLSTRSYARERGWIPLATLKAYAYHAGDPQEFITAPVHAIDNLCQKVGWSWEEIDYFEINEAFAIAPLIAMRLRALSHERVNIYGGSCALGHPLGATGARLLGTMAHILNTRNKKRGVVALCIGSGEGIAFALER